MTRIHLALLLSVVLAAVSGCNRYQIRPVAVAQDPSTLDRWLESDLVPYLTQQLSDHPRFRQEPVVLVKLNGDDIQPEIDRLTQGLRLRLRDALLATQGVNLAWEPSRKGDIHHRRLASIDCRNTQRARYYIGIEISPLVSGSYRVSVRALDIDERRWVSGFGKSWQGPLTPGEQQALAELGIDEALRGLRMLPFHADQMDLAADYLANNLECLLRQQERDELLVYVEQKKSSLPVLSRLLGMIGSHLSRYGELRITDNRDEGAFILRGEAHRLNDGLYQIWIRLNPRRSGTHLAGMDTATYIRTSAVDNLAAGPEKPQISKLSLSPTAGRSFACNESGDQDCYNLEVDTVGAEELFLFAYDAQTGVGRLKPGRCRTSQEPATGARQGRYRISGIQLPENRGEGTVYAIAANGRRLREALNRHIDRIPDRCDGGSDGLSSEELDRWLDGLDRLIDGHRQTLAWSAVRTPG